MYISSIIIYYNGVMKNFKFRISNVTFTSINVNKIEFCLYIALKSGLFAYVHVHTTEKPKQIQLCLSVVCPARGCIFESFSRK